MKANSKVVLHTAIVETCNLDMVPKFYREGLLLGEPIYFPNHLGFNLGNAYLGFDLVEKARSEYPGAVSLWFEVEDLQETFERFVSLGAEVKYEPTHKPSDAILPPFLTQRGMSLV